MHLPSAIIFVNGDGIDGYGTATLVSQLYIDGYMSKSEFDNRVLALPNYTDFIHANNYRILVILPTFRDYTNRELADVVIFVKSGLAAIEKNKFGPPGLTLPIERINIYALLRGAGSTLVVILPNSYSKFPGCQCCCEILPYQQPKCDCRGKWLGGIFAIQSSDTTGVHLPNCDNEYNNQAFINRK